MDRNRNKWVVLTAGNKLCLDVIQNLHNSNSHIVKAIIFDEEIDKPKRSFFKKLRYVYKYQGILGLLRSMIAKLIKTEERKTEEHPTLRGKSGIRHELEIAAEELGAEFISVSGINSKSSLEILSRLNADYGMVIGTTILKPHVYTAVNQYMVNVHQGKIPDYRGGSIVFWNLFNECDEFWVSVHKVEEAVDSGRVLNERKLSYVYDHEKYGLNFDHYINDVHLNLHEMCIELITETMLDIEEKYNSGRDPDLSKGKRYRKPTFKQKQLLTKRLKTRYSK